ncbi:hypothetical protein KBB05_02765, partial [Patescibacteria group bacterium]|nr:hypothetical protein [Patescibacteria group bacterium]
FFFFLSHLYFFTHHCMKFLSNFDTSLEQALIKKYTELYRAHGIFVIHRAKIFWVLHCVFPTL